MVDGLEGLLVEEVDDEDRKLVEIDLDDTAEEVLSQVDELVDRLIKERFKRVPGDKLGIDGRAGTLYVDDDGSCIAISNRNRGTIEYYGGFQYVDKENVRVCGQYTFYSGDDSRVNGCLDRLRASCEEETE